MNIQDVKQKYGIIGNNAMLERAVDIARQVAPTDLNVVINGESGTGKELVARAIHDRSPRRPAPFLVQNCAAIPEALVESELLGGTQGAFASAERPRRGLLAQAEHGTLFLGHIHAALGVEWPIINAQDKFLDSGGGVTGLRSRGSRTPDRRFYVVARRITVCTDRGATGQARA